ncbi:MAG TPA: hypothetical protein VKA91_04095 [Nitrososphaeraceae archaeon]|nr:hypothetical protein [Nitrososphaeraceae archaeon]
MNPNKRGIRTEGSNPTRPILITVLSKLINNSLHSLQKYHLTSSGIAKSSQADDNQQDLNIS